MIEDSFNNNDSNNDNNNNDNNNNSNNNDNNGNTKKIMNNNFNNNFTNNALIAIADGCNMINSKIKLTESPPISHNDHDVSLLEIIIFVTSSISNELLTFIHKYNDVCIKAPTNYDNFQNLNYSNNSNNLNLQKINSLSHANKCNETSSTILLNNKYFLDKTAQQNIKCAARTVVSTDMMQALENLIENQKNSLIIQKCLFNVLKCYANPLG